MPLSSGHVHNVRLQAERLNGFDQELAAVLRVHASLLAFHDRLEEIANYEDAERLIAEAGALNKAVLEETQRASVVLNKLPSGVQPDPTILPTLQVIQRTLQAQLEAITSLATLSDWSAVRLRLANQVRPLEFLASSLVEKVDREVSEEQTQAVMNIRRVQRRVFLLVPLTVIVTLLIAGTLGLAITRSITRPLARLVEGPENWRGESFNIRCPSTGRTSSPTSDRFSTIPRGSCKTSMPVCKAVRTGFAVLSIRFRLMCGVRCPTAPSISSISECWNRPGSQQKSY